MHSNASGERRFEVAFASTADHIVALGMAGTRRQEGKEK